MQRRLRAAELIGEQRTGPFCLPYRTELLEDGKRGDELLLGVAGVPVGEHLGAKEPHAPSAKSPGRGRVPRRTAPGAPARARAAGNDLLVGRPQISALPIS